MAKLNRVLGSTTGSDVEYVELFGAPGESLEGLSLIVVESDDQASNGSIDFRLDFDAQAMIGSEGFFLVGNSLVSSQYPGVTPDIEIPDNSIENSSYTIALVETASLSGSAVSGGEIVIDAVGVTDGEGPAFFFFGAPVVGPDGSFLPAGVFRLADGVDTDTAADFGLADFFLSSDPPPRSAGGLQPLPEPTDLEIYEIQGDGLTSEFDGERVRTTGIVTAVDGSGGNSGYYIQSRRGDRDVATSDAIFVKGDGVSVGDLVTIVGTVEEDTPGGVDTRNQPTTRIVQVTETEILASGVALPAAVVLGGPGGRVPPGTSTEDAIAFFESLEAMLVTAEDLLAVAPTNRFNEIFGVVKDETGAYPELSDRGTANIAEGDFNPEKIQVNYDSGIAAFAFPDVDTGAGLGDVTGVVSYAFGNYEILPTADFTSGLVESAIAPEVTALTGSDSQLTVASYNVLNLDPNDADGDSDVALGRFDSIARQIVLNLGAPDIVALQEIQDNNGSEVGGTTEAGETLQLLADAIVAAGGPRYEVIDTPDVPGTFTENGDVVSAVGGQPGGNIRTAYLYNPERVSLVEGSVMGLTDGDGDPFPFFEGRIPLVAQWAFNGETFTTINVHLSSKGGSAPILGVDQPFDTAAAQEDPDINGSLDQRLAQATFIRDFIEGLDDPDQVVVLGDLNEFEFVSPVELLSGPGFTNLTETLGADERYSFIFQGNSQSLDHIIVADPFAPNAGFDAVHVNAEFAETADRASDHDPLVAALDFAPVANDDRARTLERKFVNLDVLRNDLDPGGSDLFIAEVNGEPVGRRPVFFIEENGERIGLVRLERDGTLSIRANRDVDMVEFTYRASDGNYLSDEATVAVQIDEKSDVFTLNLLHVADQEAGSRAVDDAPRLSAVLNALRSDEAAEDADATLTLSSGDAFIPGLFYDASEQVFGSGGIADIQIQNELGIQAIAFGNHEFDFGPEEVAALISGDAPGSFAALAGTALDGQDFRGAAFPYLSSNLDFGTSQFLAGLEVAGGQAPMPNVVTSSTVIEEAGELFGVIGATTPTLGSISSPGDVGVFPDWAGTTPTDAELDALAAIIQAEVDQVLAHNPAINKVILLAHMQQIEIEFALAERLTDVDIVVAGGSNTRLLDETDRLRDGDSAQGVYPTFIDNAGGTTTAVVNTDGSYKYVGRLAIDFDAEGNIIAESYDPEVSGAFATDTEGVAALAAEGLIDPEIAAIADAIRDQILATEGNVFGVSNVFLNGNRSGTFDPDETDGVRTQETNLGNLTADANLDYANEIWSEFDIWLSLKNGGGIRASIGQTVVPPGGSEAVRTVNEAIFDENGVEVKPEGGISQNDIQTTLAFNNDLVVGQLTGAEIVALLEFGIDAYPSVSGRFAQVSGVEFSFDPSAPAGSKIDDAAFVDENGDIRAVLVDDGTLVNADALYGIVTLGFLAGGGDGYPFPSDFDFTSLDTDTRTGVATFADDGTEQDALAEYLAANHATAATAYDEADTGFAEDDRIVNLAFQDGSDLDLAVDEFQFA